MDSWDQAPAASALETLVTTTLAHEVYGRHAPAGGDDSTQPATPTPEPHDGLARSGLTLGPHGHPTPTPEPHDGPAQSAPTPEPPGHPAAAPDPHDRPPHSAPTPEPHDGPPQSAPTPDTDHPDRAHPTPDRAHPAPDAGRPDRAHPTPDQAHPAPDVGRPDQARPTPDALITTGGTEANQLAVLLAREAAAPGEPVHLFVGANAHHSLVRAAWLLGLPEPVVVPAPAGTLDPAALDEALTDVPGPKLVAATAGTTDAGLIDPLPEIADVTERHGARLHIDAAYGGGALFSPREAPKLHGLARAHTVALDLHKLGWQPVAAGILAVRDTTETTALGHQADYLNADDDTEAGLPDLLGRSLRTTRRPDVLKTAVTLKALGRTGLAALVDDVTALAHHLARLVDADPRFELYDTPTLTTVLFRPSDANDETVAAIRRGLLTEGRAVLGRARMDGRLYLKATLLNPHATPEDLTALLDLVEGHTPR
ncbi:aminotransferase class V-fold PLP-dependent enzyme [Streptomyces sp. NPDC006422]|uniref:aminotransferase class V-fold PLP-dependent enzyme n=1 Tax=Streptomyces sp. NPDC006422 TaxID=3155457 RepID=UPI0033A24177